MNFIITVCKLDFMKYDFYGIGNILIDIFINVQNRDLAALNIQKGTMSFADEKRQNQILSHLKNKEKCYSCGGSCPNTMITLSELGAKTALGGKAGNDKWKEIYLNRLSGCKNLTSAISAEEGTTGSSIVLITPDFERSMNTSLGINKSFSPKDIDEKILKNSRFFYFTGYMWDSENQKQAMLKALDICKSEGIKVAFDVADPFAVKRYKNDFLILIENNCDIVFANKKEAASLFDDPDPKKCASMLASLNCIGIVKAGAEGSYIKNKNEDIISIPILEDKGCVDTTGAGDTFAAGFLYGYNCGKSAEESGRCASIAASAIVAKTGAQFTKEEIAELKQKIKI